MLVSGSDFSAHAAIDIYFDAADEAVASANGSGSFSNISIEVPASALPGNHWVTAEQRSNDNQAQAPFTVNTNWAQFAFNAKGKRFNPYENVLSPSTVGNIEQLWSFNPASNLILRWSLALANGVLFIGNENSTYVYALDANTGTVLWNYVCEAAE